MWSNTLDKISFWSLLATLVLLPVFFLPFTQIPIEIAKGLLIVVGLAITTISYLIARFSDGKITLPRSLLLAAGGGVVLAVLLSALFSSSRGMSFFGTMFDFGTFWFIFTAFLFLLLSSLIFQSRERVRMVLWGIVIAGSVVLAFQALRLFMPAILSFGILPGKTDNVLGSWNALGLLALLLLVSGQFIYGLLPNQLQLPNTEVRPSFSSTALVAKSSLVRDPIFGLGPNRFADAWAMHKTANINTTAFWNTSFDSGVGAFPTFFATTGLVGVLSWLTFFVLLIIYGGRSLLQSLKKNDLRAEEMVFFMAALFLFIAFFFFPAGSVIFLLAMAGTGIFIGFSSAGSAKEQSFFTDPRKSF